MKINGYEEIHDNGVGPENLNKDRPEEVLVVQIVFGFGLGSFGHHDQGTDDPTDHQ